MSEIINRKRRLVNSSLPLLEKRTSQRRIFVMHRHLGSILHYDLRIEVNGILKNWAIPAGPSMNPADRRLAILTDDLPISYANFKGKVPEGDYGAGIVERWDKGTYVPHSFHNSACNEHDISCQLKEGRLKFTLNGKKLRGVFSLVRINGNSQYWLLIKGNDKFAVSHSYNSEHFIKSNSMINKFLSDQSNQRAMI